MIETLAKPHHVRSLLWDAQYPSPAACMAPNGRLSVVDEHTCAERRGGWVFIASRDGFAAMVEARALTLGRALSLDEMVTLLDDLVHERDWNTPC